MLEFFHIFSDVNWWKGGLDGRSGLFPANFVTSDLTPEPKPGMFKGGGNTTYPISLGDYYPPHLPGRITICPSPWCSHHLPHQLGGIIIHPIFLGESHLPHHPGESLFASSPWCSNHLPHQPGDHYPPHLHGRIAIYPITLKS